MNWLRFFRTRSKNLLPKSRTAYLQKERCSTKINGYLDEALDEYNYEETNFMPLRFKDGGWSVGDSFSSAQITTLQYLRDDAGLREPYTVDYDDIYSGKVKTYLIPFKSLFYNGFHALESLRKGTPISLPKEKTEDDRYLLQYATNALVVGFLCGKGMFAKSFGFSLGKRMNLATFTHSATLLNAAIQIYHESLYNFDAFALVAMGSFLI